MQRFAAMRAASRRREAGVPHRHFRRHDPEAARLLG